MSCVICKGDHPTYTCTHQTCKWCSLVLTETHREQHCYASVCTYCKSQDRSYLGHVEEVCDFRVICKFCRATGHDVAACENLKNTVCKKCDNSGHTPARCPEQICQRCKGKGHNAYACSTPECVYCKKQNARAMKHGLRPITYVGHSDYDSNGDVVCERLLKHINEVGCGRCGYLGHTAEMNMCNDRIRQSSN